MDIEIVGGSSPEVVPESNELDKNSQGGTELMKHGLYKRLDQSLLKKFQIIPFLEILLTFIPSLLITYNC